MEKYQLTNEELKRFEKDGYLVIEPHRIFSEEQIASIRQESLNLLPSFEEGWTEPKPRQIPYTLTGPVRNYSLVKKLNELRKNKLFAKRSTVIAPNFTPKLVEALENPRLLEFNKKLLNCDALSLHNSAIACVYPGRVCEPRMMHVDTPGFTYQALEAVKKNHFVLNTFVYLVDVDEATAPLRVVPGSAKHFLDINKHVAKYFRSTEDKINIGQLNLYEEMLPDNLEKPVLITGKAGTVTLMSGSLLHSATPNITDDRTRLTFTINYSNRNSPYFFKDYSAYAKACAGFISMFKDKEIPKMTFLKNSSSTTYKLRKKAGQIKQNLKSIIQPKKKQVEVDFSGQYTLRLSPWHKEASLGHGNITILAGELLKYENKEAKRVFGELMKSHPTTKRVVLAVPDVTRFLQAYYDKDYVFFKKLPLFQYFLEESLVRYVIRYFSLLASSFAQDNDLLECMNRDPEIFFNNLSKLEERLSNSLLDLSYLEKDITRSRWTKNDLTELLHENKMSIVEPTEEELMLVLKHMGAERTAWLMMAGEH